MKTSELTGPALDGAVAKCKPLGEGTYWTSPEFLDTFEPSTDWSQGGPIIDREKITTAHNFDANRWEADMLTDDGGDFHNGFGPTPLIAAMRCFVASKLGDTVEIPEERI